MELNLGIAVNTEFQNTITAHPEVVPGVGRVFRVVDVTIAAVVLFWQGFAQRRVDVGEQMTSIVSCLHIEGYLETHIYRKKHTLT